jgi:glutaconate CoA-transferase subunit B
MRGGEFVEKLDYFTSPGYLDGGDARDRSGLFPKNSGPSRLITRKGIFEFDPVTKEMYLAEIHPRMTVEGIKKDVPWDLKISENLSETEKPSEEEIDFIRKFAPAAAMGRALATETAFANLAGELEARGKIQTET